MDFDAVARAQMSTCLAILPESQLLVQTDKACPIGPEPFVPVLLDILDIWGHFAWQ